MCVVFLHYHPSSTPVAFSAESGGSQCTCPYLLVLAVNRDEFLERSTKPLGYWGEDNSILAGQDVQKEEKGTWLGVSKKGRLAVLTNYRCHRDQVKPDAKTRGLIVSDFLSCGIEPQQYCRSLLEEGGVYNGFSSIVADLKGDSEVVYCTNRGNDEDGGVCVLTPGNYGLSNQMLDSPWRKVQRGKRELEQVLQQVDHSDQTQLTDALMGMLADDTCLYPDPNIPDTGFSGDVLKTTSSIFVQPINIYGHPYGTRTNSVVLVDRKGNVTFTERTMTVPIIPEKPVWSTSQYTFNIQ